MCVTLRQFRREDIPLKVKWINNPENNAFLHYETPISLETTEKWFKRICGQKDRYDAVIEMNGVPVGLIGFLNIDERDAKAEYYITMGEQAYKKKGIARLASVMRLHYGFEKRGLNRIYLYTELANQVAQKLFESLGFVKEGILRQDVVSRGSYVDRIVYGLLREEWKV